MKLFKNIPDIINFRCDSENLIINNKNINDFYNNTTKKLNGLELNNI